MSTLIPEPLERFKRFDPKLIQVYLFENMRKLERITKLTPVGQYLFYVFNLHKKGRKKEQKGKEEIHVFIYFVRCLTF